jgi:hypothetical protein
METTRNVLVPKDLLKPMSSLHMTDQAIMAVGSLRLNFLTVKKPAGDFSGLCGVFLVVTSQVSFILVIRRTLIAEIARILCRCIASIVDRPGRPILRRGIL